MSNTLLMLSEGDLREVAAAIRANRLSSPFTAMTLRRVIPEAMAEPIASHLQRLTDLGFNPETLATTLELLADDRRRRTTVEDVIDVVTTGPEASGVTNRDTSVVVRELFANAHHSVLVAGYAVYQGQRVFGALADRMQEIPQLRVQMFLDIQRGPGDSSAGSELARRFTRRFIDSQWPKGRPLPEAFYFPPSLDCDKQKRLCLHAKCVVVDREVAFVSSANFTEAAQERNIELGLLIRSPLIAERIVRHFEALLENQILAPLPLLI